MALTHTRRPHQRAPLWCLAGLAILSFTGSTWACGHCLEDRIASVYDHALVERSHRQGRTIMYLRWDGPVARDAALGRAMAAAAAGVAGVSAADVRVALEPPTLAVPYDPRQISADALEKALALRLRRMKMTVDALPEISATN